MEGKQKSDKSLESPNAKPILVEEGLVVADQTALTWVQQFKDLKKSWRSAAASAAAASLAVLIGYDLTLIGSIIANSTFVEDFGLYDESLDSWTLPASRQLVWTLCQFLAAMLGAATVGQLSDRFGRSLCVYTTICLTFIGTTVELVSPNWKVWCIAKLLFGLSMGSMQANTQTYVSELAPQHIRGFMLSLFQLWIVIGSFLASCVLEGTSNIVGSWSWKAAIVSQFGIGAICFSLFFFLTPESPYFLVSRGRIEEAKKSLVTLRGREDDYDADMDIGVITATIEHEQELTQGNASYLECFKGVDRRRTLIACLPMVMQQLGGFPLCGNYLAYFLSLSGVEDAFLITMVTNCLAIGSVLLSFGLIEKVGRRTQLLCGFAAMLPCLAAITLLGWVARGTVANSKALAALAILWNVFYYVSVGAVGWTIVGEISSTRLRAKTTSIATILNAIINLAWAVAIPYLINEDELNLGPKGGAVFLGPSIILLILAYFIVPETKGMSFALLDQLFHTHTPARKFGGSV